MAAVALMMWLTCIRNQGLHDHYTHQQGATRKSTFYAASMVRNVNPGRCLASPLLDYSFRNAFILLLEVIKDFDRLGRLVPCAISGLRN